MVLGYTRVSKGQDQDTRMQETTLRAAGVERLFTEQASGGRWDRPQLHRLLDQLRPEDVVVVWKLDRLSRSLKDLLHIMEQIAQAGAGFRSLTEAIDTTTPAGRMLMQMVGSFGRTGPGADWWTSAQAGAPAAGRHCRHGHIRTADASRRGTIIPCPSGDGQSSPGDAATVGPHVIEHHL